MTPRKLALAAAAVLPAALAVPALANMLSTSELELAALVQTPAPVASAPAPLGNIVLASAEYDDDDDDDDDGWFFGRGHDDDDDDDRYEDDDCDDDDDDGACMYGQAGNTAPAPAGTATPPDNGLFAPGGAAVIQAN